ncbi:MAG: NAD(P)/FAD-dependent oxidoreductase [Chloroflexota bacterium]|nr:MAG: NAD(P)/FAD-dependent oxidoreductase [Chloroflexota bacterium]
MRVVDVVVVGGGPAGAACAITCAKHGQNTVLLEKGMPGRHKVCGGIMPTVCIGILKDDLGLKMPDEVMCTPHTLGLFYVPPSGRRSGAAMRNYRLLNVNRDRLDHWLLQIAEDSGVNVLYGTEFLDFQNEGTFRVRAGNKDRVTEVQARFLIGADGVFSKVRTQLHRGSKAQTMMIVQEYWQAKGEFEEHFYTFLKGEVTSAYGYLIPKDGRYLIGVGEARGGHGRAAACLRRFTEWLTDEFAFEPVSLERKEAGAIPYNSLFGGDGNAILVGDAAGFCNPFSGEGIRLGIESGIMAGEAIVQANESGKTLSSLYHQQIEGLSEFIRSTYEFSVALTDKEREEFVSTELQRGSLAPYYSGPQKD